MVEKEEEKHQCHTCRWGELTTPPSPGETGTGVNCRNMLLVEYMEGRGVGGLREEYADYGCINLFTIEEVGGEDAECHQWNSRTEEVRNQVMPAPDDAPLTACPWCGQKYNVQEPDAGDYQKIADDIYKHTCGHLVRYAGYPK